MHVSSYYRGATNLFQMSFSCDSVSDNVWYFISLSTQSSGTQTCRIDFSSLNQLTVSDTSGSSDYFVGITAVNEHEAIATALTTSGGYKHKFYRYNFTSDTFSWAVQADSLSK